jgi:hypothetical protein
MGYIDDVNQQRKLIDSLLVDSALYHLTGDAEKSDKFVKDFVASFKTLPLLIVCCMQRIKVCSYWTSG